MTLDPSLPVDEVAISEIPSYIRALTAALTGSTILTSSVVLDAIDTTITGSSVAFEIIKLSGNAPASPNTITAGDAGAIKIILALDGNITLVDSAGNLNLRGAAAAPDFPMLQGDIIVLLYDDVAGTWTEVARSLG